MQAALITGQPGMSVYESRLWLHNRFWQTLKSWSEIADRMVSNWGDYHPCDVSAKAKTWVAEGLIASSFHPFAMDEFNASRILIYVNDGFVRLSDHPKHKKWEEAMLSGEFWTHAKPEEWLELSRLTDDELIEFFTK